MPRYISTLFVASALLMSPACGSEGTGDDEEVALVIGTGEAAFETLRSGDHLSLHAGTQGGHHVWLSVRARGLEPEGLRMLLDVIPTQPAPEAHSDVRIDFTRVTDATGLSEDAGAAGDWIEFVGWPAQVLAPECAADKPVRLELTLEDRHGRKAYASSEIVAEPPQAGFQAVCNL